MSWWRQAAKVRKVRRQKITLRLGMNTSEKVARRRSLAQGGPDAPEDFNLFFDQTIHDFEKNASKRKWDIV